MTEPRTVAGRALHAALLWSTYPQQADADALILAIEAEAAGLTCECGHPDVCTPPAEPTLDVEYALNLLNSLGIYGPNIIHAEQGMHPDGKHSVDRTWDGPGTCVCRLPWPCEAKALGELVAALIHPDCGDHYIAGYKAATAALTPPPAEPTLDRDEAIRAALIFVFQWSDRQVETRLNAMTPLALVRALEQDGWTVARLATEGKP
jgi:hypothetical protein